MQGITNHFQGYRYCYRRNHGQQKTTIASFPDLHWSMCHPLAVPYTVKYLITSTKFCFQLHGCFAHDTNVYNWNQSSSGVEKFLPFVQLGSSCRKPLSWHFWWGLVFLWSYTKCSLEAFPFCYIRIFLQNTFKSAFLVRLVFLWSYTSASGEFLGCMVMVEMAECG